MGTGNETSNAHGMGTGNEASNAHRMGTGNEASKKLLSIRRNVPFHSADRPWAPLPRSLRSSAADC